MNLKCTKVQKVRFLVFKWFKSWIVSAKFCSKSDFLKKNQSNTFCEQFKLFRFETWSWVCFSDSPWRIPSVPKKKNVLYGTMKKDFCGFLCWSKELFASILQPLDQKGFSLSKWTKKTKQFCNCTMSPKKLACFSRPIHQRNCSCPWPEQTKKCPFMRIRCFNGQKKDCRCEVRMTQLKLLNGSKLATLKKYNNKIVHIGINLVLSVAKKL